MDKRALLTKLFSGNKQLPSIPSLYSEFKKLSANPFASNKKISELIMRDQSMVTKILRLSNSALYYKSQEVKTLVNAITYLGTETIENMILQISLVKMFKMDADMPEFNISVFWEHSLSTAYFSTLIAKKLRLAEDENHYLGGLLHDIGKLAIYQFYPEKFKQIVLLQLNEGVIDVDAEMRVLGVDHTDIGTFLAEKWKFNPEIINSIRLHHKALGSMGVTAALVRISNMFSKASGLCFPWDDVAFSIVDDPAWGILTAKLDDKIDCEKLTFDISEETDTIKNTVTTLLTAK